MIATIAIPCAPHHRDLVQHAISSAYAQTIPCAVRVFYDDDQRGAGYARNRLLEMVETPFVVFLDSDDTLEPGFVETCLKAYKPGYYVYSNWWQKTPAGELVEQQAPLCDEWITDGKTRMHLVTTLLPMAIPRRLKGFDENIPAIEDTDFYLRLRTKGYCGIRVDQPLVYYSRHGQRSKLFEQRSDRYKIREQVWARYEGQIVGCCGSSTPISQAPAGERQSGDILAEALFPPRSEYGIVTQRYYRPRYTGDRLWVARADAQARPDMWRMVEDPEAHTPDVDFVVKLMAEGLAHTNHVPLTFDEPDETPTEPQETQLAPEGKNYEQWLVDDLRLEVERRGLTPEARRKVEYIKVLLADDNQSF